MELIDFSKNKNSFKEIKSTESILLWGDPNAIPDAEITICIPTYKRPKLLEEAIKSAVNQDTNIPYRIIVVDNDDNFENNENLNIINKFNNKKISYYKNSKNIGMYGNINRCAELALTRWFALLHDDDLLKSNYINEVSKILLKYKKSIDLLILNMQQINYPFLKEKNSNKKKKIVLILKAVKGTIKNILSLFTPKLTRIPVSSNMFLGNVYGPPTCGILFKKLTFLDSGGFNKDYYPSSDWFFLIYFSKKYKVLKLKKYLGCYRWEDNESLKKETLEAFKNQRKECILSLSNNFLCCKIIYLIFKKEFIKLFNSSTIIKIKHSIFYRLIQIYYIIKLFV